MKKQSFLNETCEEKWMWMTNYFSCDTGMTLSKLEQMGVDMEKFIDELSSDFWPANMYDFKNPEEAIQFILRTFDNFHKGEVELLKANEDEAIGVVKCGVPYYSTVMPKERGFQFDLSKRKENIWCQYWCKFWFKNGAAKAGWDYDVKHEGDKCIWTAKKLK